jgi:hypothetical protein
MAKGLIFAAGLALAASTLSAQALPVGRADLGQGSLVTNVAQGCGPGGFRDWRGFCRYDGPRYGRPRVYGPPRVYGGGRRAAPSYSLLDGDDGLWPAPRVPLNSRVT